MSNLAALLEKEAGAEIEGIISEAKKTASELIAKAEEEAKSIIALKERNLKSQREAELVRAKSSAQLEASSMRLKARNGGVEAVFDNAKKTLSQLTKSEKYKAIFNSLYQEAANVVGEVAEVIVNPNDVPLVSDKDVKIITDESLTGGIKLKGQGSSVVVENSLFSRLEAIKEDLASLVSKTLFGDEKGN